jgi:The  BURPS668_1122 family of deaminases
MKPQFSHSRDADSEWQLLEHIANGLPRGATGRIDLYTEREPCGDCQNVISQFEQAYPGVKVNVSWG